MSTFPPPDRDPVDELIGHARRIRPGLRLAFIFVCVLAGLVLLVLSAAGS